jgi:hypothetical protein
METSMKKALITSILVPLLITPVSAATKMHREAAVTAARNSAVVGAESNRRIQAAGAIPRAARNAFGMSTGSPFTLDANSPEATGGGSLGYNEKLLEY